MNGMHRLTSEHEYVLKQMVMEKVTMVHEDKVPAHYLMNGELVFVADHMSRNIKYFFDAKLTAGHWSTKEEFGDPTVRYENVPATWWDAFKLRFFPLWAQVKWPPTMRSILTNGGHSVVNHYNYWVFPDIPPAAPKHIKNFVMSYYERRGP
jgi:hypothetical protein